MSKCRSCGADIDWIKTKEGKNMPVNVEYVNVHPNEVGGEKGNTVIVTDEGEVVRGIQVGDAYEDGYLIGRTSHFATCPEAEQFRRK